MSTISTQELLHLMKTRRSVRSFQDKPVQDEVIHHLLEAAIWGPSSHNRQPWRFVVIRENQDRLADAMASRLRSDLQSDGVSEEFIRKDTERSRRRLTSAPVLILVCLSMEDMDTYPDPVRNQNEYIMAVQSVALASQNLLLMAHAQGLGAFWMCAPLFCPDTVKDTLDLPHDYIPQGIIAVGYPDEQPTRTRRPLETRVIYR